jgi:hypothetical protein
MAVHGPVHKLYYTQPTKTTSIRTQLDALYGHFYKYNH